MSNLYHQPILQLFGMNVFVTPETAKMKMAPGDYITEDFRKEIDAWLLSFFGTISVIPDGQMIVSEQERAIYMNPKTFNQIRSNPEYIKDLHQ